LANCDTCSSSDGAAVTTQALIITADESITADVQLAVNVCELISPIDDDGCSPKDDDNCCPEDDDGCGPEDDVNCCSKDDRGDDGEL